MDALTSPDEPTIDEIDDTYSDVDPEDVTENAIDYFRGKPETESGKTEPESNPESNEETR